eukprot:2147842-Pleurochrysis_carterae.AAC.2
MQPPRRLLFTLIRHVWQYRPMWYNVRGRQRGGDAALLILLMVATGPSQVCLRANVPVAGLQVDVYTAKVHVATVRLSRLRVRRTPPLAPHDPYLVSRATREGSGHEVPLPLALPAVVPTACGFDCSLRAPRAS